MKVIIELDITFVYVKVWDALEVKNLEKTKWNFRSQKWKEYIYSVSYKVHLWYYPFKIDNSTFRKNIRRLGE